MTRSHATVDSVEIRTRGSFTIGATATGETVLPVFLAADFDEDGGDLNIGAAVINGQLVGGTPAKYVSKSTTGTGDTITLATALLADVPDRTPVYLDPPVQSKVAHVIRAEVFDATDTEEADIPSGHLWADSRLAEGVTGGQTVLVERTPGRNSRLRVIEITGSEPVIDGSKLDGHIGVTPGAVITSMAERTDEWEGGAPPRILGDGPTNADIDFQGRVRLNAVEHTALGMVARKTAGGASLFVAPDGTSQVGGQGNFDHLVSRAALLAGQTDGAPGGKLVLGDAGMLDPPAQPPITDPHWITSMLDLPAGVDPRNLKGLGGPDEHHFFCLRISDKGQVRVVKFDPTDGGTVTQDPLTGAPTQTVVVDADYQSRDGWIQTLEYDPAALQWLVRLYDFTTLVFDHEWVCTQLETLGPTQAPMPAIGCFCDPDTGVDEYTRVVQANPDGTVNIHRFHNEAFVATSVTTDSFVWGNSGSLDIVACASYGGMLFLTGRSNVVTGTSTWPGIAAKTPVIPVIDLGIGGHIGDTLGYLQAENGDLACVGLAAIDTDTDFLSWYKAAGSGLVARQSNVLEAGGYWTGCTYLDSTTGHRTVMQTPTLEVKIPGANVTYTIGEPPPGSTADSMEVYFARDVDGSVPLRTDFHLQATSAPGEWHADVFTVDLTTANPPATGDLPSGDPFEITVGAVAQIRGDHTGEIYDLIAASSDGGSW